MSSHVILPDNSIRSLASQGAGRTIDWLCAVNKSHFDVMFLHDVISVPTKVWNASPFFVFAPEFMTAPKLRKQTAALTRGVENIFQNEWFGKHLHIRFQYDVEISVWNLQNWAWDRRITPFSWWLVFNTRYGILFVVHLLMGDELGKTRLPSIFSICRHSALLSPTNLIVIGNDSFIRI